MRQKDYKAIANILDRQAGTNKGNNWTINKADLIEELADYFEEDRKEMLKDCGYKEILDSKELNFDKKQFIKGCGIK